MATDVNTGGSAMPRDLATAAAGAAPATAAKGPRPSPATKPSAPERPGKRRGKSAGKNPPPTPRLGAFLDEAQAAVSASANVLRDVRERYRAAQLDGVARWQELRSELAAKNGKSRASLVRDETVAAAAVGAAQAALARLELALRSLENAWLFLDPADESLVSDPSDPASAADVQMRIVEAQEAERSRLAREVHDGPAQALSNGIFQVEIIERLLDRDERLARQELKALRDTMTRELRAVRAYLSQLRPPLLADLGLSGAIKEAAEQIASVIGLPVEVEIDPHIDALPESVEVVILRVVQEALQNVRKHASPRKVRVTAVRDGKAWVIEIRDDGVGFDPDRRPSSGRRSFGLQFMRERAELIGGRFEVRSRPELGTVVRLVIPRQEEETR
jgi:two-component system, NarL family, sensor histidine kinase DegS